MGRINELQSPHIKQLIKTVLVLRPLPIDQIIRLVCLKTMPNIAPSREEKEKIKQLTSELIFEGQVNASYGKIELNERYRVSSVEEDYLIEEPEGKILEPLNVDGSYVFETVGSERYPFIWKELQEGQTVEVELIAEPTNTRDSFAVAICINKKPYAYMPRPEAARYHPVIVKARSQNYTLVTKAKVAISESILNHKIFIMNLETPEKILQTIGEQ